MAAQPDTTVAFRQGAGRLCLDFIRTLRHRDTAQESEELVSPAALAAWVAQCGPAMRAPSELPDVPQVRDAERLREAIRELLDAGRGPLGAPGCSAAARRRVNQAAARPVPAPALGASGTLRWDAGDPVAATLALVARDALDLVASAAITRVRECADAHCGALFIDSSRPGTRRWCSMGVCGNRAKKDTLRRRVSSRAAVGQAGVADVQPAAGGGSGLSSIQPRNSARRSGVAAASRPRRPSASSSAP